MIWGRPEVYTDEDEARTGIGSRIGVVSIFRIGGGAVGHIDLFGHRPGSRFQDCAHLLSGGKADLVLATKLIALLGPEFG